MKVLIWGSNGQDGSYLSELLLERGDIVIGVVRRSSTPNTSNLYNCIGKPNFILEQGDITDFSSVFSLLNKYNPDWIFNLAAQSHVGTSFNQPLFTTNATYLGHLNLLEAVRLYRQNLNGDGPRIYFAGSSEEFGRNYETGFEYEGKYQTLDTPKAPSSPYGVAKVAAHNLSEIYRLGYGIDVRVGVLGNHESPRRGEHFVTRKITKYIGQFFEWRIRMTKEERGGFSLNYDVTPEYISLCRHNKNRMPYGHIDSWAFGCKFPKLKLGNLDICRDWGYSKDYCEAMIKIMEYPESRDFLVGTGETYTIKEFAETAFNFVDLPFSSFIDQDSSQLRPVEVPYLRMKCDETYDLLNWRPKTTFKELVRMMVDHDVKTYSP